MHQIINWAHPPNSTLTRIFRDPTFPKYFMIDWMLHDKCTYDCSYCPPANKSGNDGRLQLDTLDVFCNKLESHVKTLDPAFKIVVLFTGGEPTVWKHFGALVSRLDNRGWKLIVNSNGSRSEKWWEEHAKKFTSIILSYHTESVNDEEFIRKLKICEQFTKTSVNVMLNPNDTFFQKSTEIAEKIKNETTQVVVVHYKIQHTFGLQEINVPQYTQAQLLRITELADVLPVIKIPPLPDSYRAELENKEIIELSPTDLLNTNQANFKNWTCHVGLESIFIDAKGDVIRGACRVGEVMGNISAPEEIKWATSTVICPYNWCGCVTDIKNSKEKYGSCDDYL